MLQWTMLQWTMLQWTMLQWTMLHAHLQDRLLMEGYAAEAARLHRGLSEHVPEMLSIGFEPRCVVISPDVLAEFIQHSTRPKIIEAAECRMAHELKLKRKRDFSPAQTRLMTRTWSNERGRPVATHPSRKAGAYSQ